MIGDSYDIYHVSSFLTYGRIILWKNYCSPSPRFNFTIEEGLSPVMADAMVEAAGPYPRMRPHLGEVHATLLADTDFFTSEERPTAPMTGAEIALQNLSQQRQAGAVNGRWYLHVVGCLEAQNRLEEAFTIAQAGLAAHGHQPEFADGLRLHLTTSLNVQKRPQDVLNLVGKTGRSAQLPALYGEQARAWFALDNPKKSLRALQKMQTKGHEIRWMYYIQGLCHEQIRQPQKALAAFIRAKE